MGYTREIIRVASQLGPAGHGVALEILKRHPRDDWVQTIALAIAHGADPTDPIQVAVADAVIGNEPHHDHGHRTEAALQGLVGGINQENADERIRLLATKVRRLANDAQERYLVMDIAALTAARDDVREQVLLAAHHLAAALPMARQFGMPSSPLLDQVRSIPGELGERLTCRVLAEATDVDRETKLTHITAAALIRNGDR